MVLPALHSEAGINSMSSGTTRILLVIIASLTLVGLIRWGQSERQKQIQNPNPIEPSAPIVLNLPDLVASLRDGKSEIEEKVSQIKEAQHRVDAKEMIKGRSTYALVKAKADETVDHLISEMVLGFKQEDEKKILSLLTETNESMIGFTMWADQQLQAKEVIPTTGDWGPAIRLFSQWFADMSNYEENEKQLAEIRTQLVQCRLKSWEDIK
jgi:hypothetical protein